MGRYLRLARLYFLLLALVTTGRWLMGTAFKVPYERGNPVFSIVTLTALAAIFYGAFCRRWLGFTPWQAAVMGFIMGLASQIVIFLATVLSYGLGIDTYFNNPIAMTGVAAAAPVPLARAVTARLGGLVANPISAGIMGALGWAFGGLLPRDK
jgi:hypothetical protein